MRLSISYSNLHVIKISSKFEPYFFVFFGGKPLKGVTCNFSLTRMTRITNWIKKTFQFSIRTGSRASLVSTHSFIVQVLILHIFVFIYFLSGNLIVGHLKFTLMENKLKAVFQLTLMYEKLQYFIKLSHWFLMT